MIEKVRLKDFQSHKDSEFDFIPGINVITGVSGVGKSSVIRALNYVFTNKKPNGVEYKRRPDAKGFEIDVVVDGHTIKRIKSAKINEYQIDGESYKDIGTSVPDKLYSATNIRPIKVGTDEFNVQLAKQFDPHFLMFLPDSSKVKFLNRLSGAHILDIALKDTNKDIAQLDKSKAINSSELLGVSDKINYLLDIIGPIQNVIKDAKEKYDMLVESVSRLQSLKELKAKLDEFNRQKHIFDSQQLVLSKVNVDGFDFRIDRLNKLKALYNSYFNTLKNINIVSETIKKIDSIDIDLLLNKTKKLDNMNKNLVLYKEWSFNNIKLLNDINANSQEIQASITRVKEFLENNPRCPTCNSTITKQKINKIIKELEG